MPHNSENTLSFIRQYWSFFETLVSDFLSTERYVTLDEDNFDTYSIEYNRLYQSICSEVDVLAKKLCELLGNNHANNISQYYETIIQHCGAFVDEEVYINRLIKIQAWKHWDCSDKEHPNNPEWWKLYNKVKHNRQSVCTESNSKWENKPYFKCATQGNVLFSLSGLFLLEFYCLLVICIQDSVSSDNDSNSIYNSLLPIFNSKLFSLPSWSGCCMSFIGTFISKKTIEQKIIEHSIKI